MATRRKPWFHVSTTWDGLKVNVNPQPGRRDTENPLDLKPCICVAPTVAQCVVALGAFGDLGKARVYRTRGEPTPAEWVWDYPVTQEHRFYIPMVFEFVKEIDLTELAMNLKVLEGLRKALDSLV